MLMPFWGKSIRFSRATEFKISPVFKETRIRPTMILF